MNTGRNNMEWSVDPPQSANTLKSHLQISLKKRYNDARAEVGSEGRRCQSRHCWGLYLKGEAVASAARGRNWHQIFLSIPHQTYITFVKGYLAKIVSIYQSTYLYLYFITPSTYDSFYGFVSDIGDSSCTCSDVTEIEEARHIAPDVVGRVHAVQVGVRPDTMETTGEKSSEVAVPVTESSSSDKQSKHVLIRELLWPTTDKIEKYQNLAGAMPDSQAIFKSNTFYKLWSARPKEMSEKDKQFLFASAIEAQTAGKITIDFTRKGPILATDEGFTTVNKKRKRNDDDDDITEETIHEYEMVARSATFAAVTSKTTKSKPKIQSKFLLHILKSQTDRVPITRAEFNEIEQYLLLTMVQLGIDGQECPKLDWMAYGNEVGLVAVEDESSMRLVKEIISKFDLAGDKFRGWEKEELYITLSVRLPASLRDETKFKDEIITMMMQKQNEVLMHAEYFRHVETKIFKPKTQPNLFLPVDYRVYKFKVDHTTLENITKLLLESVNPLDNRVVTPLSSHARATIERKNAKIINANETTRPRKPKTIAKIAGARAIFRRTAAAMISSNQRTETAENIVRQRIAIPASVHLRRRMYDMASSRVPANRLEKRTNASSFKHSHHLPSITMPSPEIRKPSDGRWL